MSRDEAIERLLAAVSDRCDAEWDELERSSSPGAERDLVQNLRALRSIAEHGAPLAAVESASARTSWAHLTLLEKLGAGSYGEVHRAWDPKLSIDVALKLVPCLYASKDDALHEGQLLARVRHENVARVYGLDQRDDFVGIWTEYVDGMTLRDVAREEAPLSEKRLLAIAMQLLSALAAIHDARILHRDLKPENVLVERGGRVVVADFGCGAFRTSRGDARRSEFAGTPRFLAPELFRGGEPTPSSDCYSIGAILFLLATGGHPVEADNAAALKTAHERGTRRLLAELRPGLSSALATSIDRALDPDPPRRWRSASEWRAALENVAPESAAPTAHAEESAASAPAAAAKVASVSHGASSVSRSAPAPAPRSASTGLADVDERSAFARWRALLPWLVVVPTAALAIWFAKVQSTPRVAFETALLRARDSGAFEKVAAAGAASVKIGDRLMLEFESPRDAHVYVLNWDDAGHAYLLFPMEGSELRNPLSGGEPHRLPGLVGGEPFAWEVSSAGSREHFAVVTSTEQLADFERAIAETPRVQLESDGTLPPSAFAGLLRGVGRAGSVEGTPGAQGPGDAIEALRRRLAEDEALAKRVALRVLTVTNSSP